MTGGGAEAFFRPVRLEIAAGDAVGRVSGVDGVLTMTWKGRGLRFGFDCKRTWSALSVQRFKRIVEGSKTGLLPLLVTSYLSDGQLDELEREGVSGLDLSGNGLLMAPPDVYVRRTGAKDRHKREAPAATIYRSWKVASLVPRVLVAQAVFPTVTSVLDACRRRMMTVEEELPPLHLSTVSKALSLLAADLVVARTGSETRLLDPERLLDRLVGAYRAPVATRRFVGRTRLSVEQARLALGRMEGVRIVVTGRGTAPRHTELAESERISLYVSDAARVVTVLAATETEVFPNVEFVETGEEGVYFDAVREDGVVWASPLQVLLELAAGDAREVEAAGTLRTRMLARMHAAMVSSKEE